MDCIHWVLFIFTMGAWRNWLAHPPVTRKVAGSSPVVLVYRSDSCILRGLNQSFALSPYEVRAILQDVVQFGRTLALGARGCRFKSCHPDHTDVA